MTVKQKAAPAERAYANTWSRLGRHFESPHTSRCQVCGLLHCHPYESDDERLQHRRHHREVLRIYEPQPSPAVFGTGPFLEVEPRSSLRVRHHLEGCALMFRRECGFDFAPYSTDDHAGEAASRQFLIVSPEGRPIGGTGARRRTFEDIGPVWEAAWIWVIPRERRRGHLKAAWGMLKEELPSIRPELPLSEAASQFFAFRMDVPEYVREHAMRNLEAAVAALEPEGGH